jgi:hypothetical protein
MQIEKFYKAQNLRKEILEMQDVISKVDESQNSPLYFIEKMSTPYKEQITSKASSLIKKELQRIVKQLEKEFNDL